MDQFRAPPRVHRPVATFNVVDAAERVLPRQWMDPVHDPVSAWEKAYDRQLTLAVRRLLEPSRALPAIREREVLWQAVARIGLARVLWNEAPAHLAWVLRALARGQRGRSVRVLVPIMRAVTCLKVLEARASGLEI